MNRRTDPFNWASSRWTRRIRTGLTAGAVAVLLAACGGNSSEEEANATPPTTNEAARFLTQATMGPNEAAIASLTQQGYSAWLTDQYAKPQTLHRSYMDSMAASLAATGGTISANNFYESWWKQALTGEDQLRQRVAFALSQIFVISFADGTVGQYPRGVATYYDMLGEKAFGNYRDLIESVTLHPMMGNYLTMLRNQKEDAASGRVPDENYAREIMQLFSIGLYRLNADGTVQRDVAGNALETYTHEDIQGLAKVFTGWSWYAGPNLTDRTRNRFFGSNANLERDFRPMQAYNRHTTNTDFHSISAKSFLGTTIAAQSTPDPEGDLKTALDTIFNHPNVGPFIGRRLIERMVTSNPSPAYVGRVAAAFNNNGAGVRGDMKAVVNAVLLDPEARTFDANSTSYGKVREPVMRLASYLRAFNATSTSGNFTSLGNTDDPATRLGQTPMRSPTVFNFFRPGYTPPNSSIAAADLVAPELQLAHEVSVAGYLNYMRGSWIPASTGRDVQQNHAPELAVADNAEALVDRMSLLLTSGQMSSTLRGQIIAGINGRTIPAPVTSNGTVTNQAAIDTAKRDRVSIAAFLTIASPDFLVQK